MMDETQLLDATQLLDLDDDEDVNAAPHLVCLSKHN